MELLNVKQHVTSCYSNEDGFVIYSKLKCNLENGKEIAVSFKDMTFVTTSFVNSAFIDLIEEFGFEKFISIVKIVDSPKSILDSIKKRIQNYQKEIRQAC